MNVMDMGGVGIVKEYGTAMGVQGGRVTVSIKRTAACEKCGRCSHPHVAFGDSSTMTIEAVPVGDIHPGDTVELEMDTGEFLKASFLVWLLPLLAAAAGLGLGWMLGTVLGNGSLWGTVFSLASFALSFFWLHQYDKSSRKSGRYMPLARPVRDL